MTERGTGHLEEILRERAGEAASDSSDPWPAVRDRVAARFGEGVFASGASAKTGSRRPWTRRLRPRTRAGWILAALAVTLFATAAYAASSMTVSDVIVEEAVLQSAPGGDRIVVRVCASGSADLPWCYLSQGTTLQDSRWFDDDLTESVNLGDETIFTFHEDKTPSGEPVDPGRTPLFRVLLGGHEPGWRRAGRPPRRGPRGWDRPGRYPEADRAWG